MAVFKVGRDYATSEHAGAGGMFQVDTLIDDNDNDVTNRIDVGTHYADDELLIKEISRVFGIPEEDIELEDS